MRRSTFPVAAAAGLVWLTIGLTYIFMDARNEAEQRISNPQLKVAASKAASSSWRNMIRGAKSAVSKLVKSRPNPAPVATEEPAASDIEK